MEIPFFSYVYIIRLVYIFVFSNNFKSIYIKNIIILFVFEILWMQGYFIKIGTFECTWVNAQLCIVLILSLVNIFTKRLENYKSLFIACIILFFSMLLSGIYDVIFPYDGYIFPNLLNHMSWDAFVLGQEHLVKYEFVFLAWIVAVIKLLCYIFIVYNMKHTLVKDDYWYMLKNIQIYSILTVVYGYLEMLCKNVFPFASEFYEFVALLIGNSSSAAFNWSNASITPEGLYRLQGLSREPSHFVMALFAFSIFILLYIKCSKYMNLTRLYRYYLELAVIALLMLFTGGMSSIWCIFSLAMVYFILNLNRRYFIRDVFTYIGGGIFVCIILFISVKFFSDEYDFWLASRFFSSLDTFIALLGNTQLLLASGLDASTLARFTSIIICISTWLERPFLGIGIGVMDAYDFTATMLVKNGLLGAMAWYYLMIVHHKIHYDHVLCIFIVLIAYFPIGPMQGLYAPLYLLFVAECTTLYVENWKVDKIVFVR